MTSAKPFTFEPLIALDITFATVEQADYVTMIPGFELASGAPSASSTTISARFSRRSSPFFDSAHRLDNGEARVV